jgi:glutamate/tyrosine decarboxylase-like PLP-dependent enzyme
MNDIDDATSRSLAVAHERAIAWLRSLDRAPVGATADVATLRRRLARPLGRDGVAPERVIEDLVADVAGGLLGTGSGRFFGWVIGGALPSALAADWLVSAWDQNAALVACSPAAAVVEEVVGVWLKEILGLPADASFALVTGCQMAHVTCLAAARHALLARRGVDVERDGLAGTPAIRILSTSAKHGSFDRAVRLLGFGSRSVVEIAADDAGRLRVDALEAELRREPARPTIVLLQAGDINTGTFDPFAGAIAVAHRHAAWVHVDGAFGLWAAASPRLRAVLDGVAGADSWATDGHKWLNVPFDCGYAFVADAASHRAALSHRASYLTHDDDARDQLDWNPDWSRRARGFPTYAALRELGRDGIAAIVERCCDHARAIVAGIGSLPGAEIAWEPALNQGLVRFLDRRAGATDADHDRRTDEVIAAIVASGEAFLGGSTWRGRRVMRVSVCNWRTSEADVARTIAAVAAALAGSAR